MKTLTSETQKTKIMKFKTVNFSVFDANECNSFPRIFLIILRTVFNIRRQYSKGDFFSVEFSYGLLIVEVSGDLTRARHRDSLVRQNVHWTLKRARAGAVRRRLPLIRVPTSVDDFPRSWGGDWRRRFGMFQRTPRTAYVGVQ